ncbi:MAG: hypothetical protein J3K34DRAFT_245571 [Monoraphidium minutum]|nr:MAG: hypothetical protein J3K34DRAFT_245571 [Monoraphidium minutum]
MAAAGPMFCRLWLYHVTRTRRRPYATPWFAHEPVHAAPPQPLCQPPLRAGSLRGAPTPTPMVVEGLTLVCAPCGARLTSATFLWEMAALISSTCGRKGEAR